MPVTKDPRLTYYEVLKKGEDGWGVFYSLHGRWAFESLNGARLIAKELERHGNMVRVRPVYVNQWGSVYDIGSVVYSTEKGRKKHDGKVQKA